MSTKKILTKVLNDQKKITKLRKLLMTHHENMKHFNKPSNIFLYINTISLWFIFPENRTPGTVGLIAYNCVPKHNDMVQNGTVAPLAVAKRCDVDHYDITLNFIFFHRSS